MKKLLPAVSAFVALASPLLAADIPSRKEVVLSPPSPVWTGFHVGLNAGGIWNNNNSINVQTWPLDGAYPPITWAPLNGVVSSGQNGGFVGGGQIGYDWQVPYGGLGFVTGVEADMQGVAASGGNNSRNSFYPGPSDGASFGGFSISETIWNNVSGSAYLKYLGTVRGRLGYLATPTLLVYGTGGLAYGGITINVNQSQFDNAIISGGGASIAAGYTAFGNANLSTTQVGYTAGGGVEWMFLPNWSAKVEYLYYNLGNVSVTSVMTGVPFGVVSSPRLLYSSTANTTISGNIVRAGVNYHFNWGVAPVVAKY